MPWAALPLYEAWKQAAAIDRNPEVFGLTGFRKLVRQLPDSAEESIDWALARLGVPSEIATDFLHRELMSVYGWSAYAAYQDRPGLIETMLPQLLAIRLAYDVAFLSLGEGSECNEEEREDGGLLEAKYIAQLALENAFRSRLMQKLGEPACGGDDSRKALQAIFCIDVRSEVYRRALEAQSPEIETVGFAGFFGMAIEFSESARCPVLIAPKYTVCANQAESSRGRWSERAKQAWMTVRSSAAGSFPW